MFLSKINIIARNTLKLNSLIISQRRFLATIDPNEVFDKEKIAQLLKTNNKVVVFMKGVQGINIISIFSNTITFI